MIDALKVVSNVLHYVAAWFVVVMLFMLAIGGVWLDFEKQMKRRRARARTIGSSSPQMTSAANAEKTSTSSVNGITLSGQSKGSATGVVADRAKTSGESC